MNKFLARTLWPLLLIAASLVQSACDTVTSDPANNEPPSTSLANIPVDEDTLFALVTLHWDGGDPDGFVDAYEYRYVTYPLLSGDSLVSEWIRTEQTSATIAFTSTDPLNRQRFEVRSIDNVGTVDLTPASKVFYTTQSFAPEAQIAFPQPGDSLFVLEQTSDWWQGVALTFSASDRDGEVEEYGWAVDDGAWQWTRDTTLFIPPSAFSSLEGTHEIRVTARDNTDLVNPEGTSVSVTLVRPQFDRELLILDATNENNFNRALGATDADVDAFYADLFGGAVGGIWDEWDYYSQGMPPLDVLGRYRMIVWHADDKPASRPHVLADQVPVVQDYLNVGGDIVMSGWRVLKSFAWQENFPLTFSEGTFVNDYMQIVEVNETSIAADMAGATGVNGFPDIRVDASKLSYNPVRGTINNVNVILSRGGFTEIIASYEASPDTRFPQYRGATIGLIYHGTSFDAAVLGFPLFFIQREDAVRFAARIVERMAQ